ncbi:hypothetical protein AN944_01139 [Shewanella sp. P1-14-1]|nr:hypothetical protein AN944_01139 [Shewanella sp. P1-14-1]
MLPGAASVEPMINGVLSPVPSGAATVMVGAVVSTSPVSSAIAPLPAGSDTPATAV